MQSNQLTRFRSAMSSSATHEDITRLLTSFDFEIDSLPDDLRCGQCKSVLKDACQVPCGCRFCRACIDAVIASGAVLCPCGVQKRDCASLTSAHPDYRACMSISRLITKCPLAGCSHECALGEMESHLRGCPRKRVDCPYRELGCRRGKLAAEEMGGHLQQDSVSHSELLIERVANMDRDMKMLKRELQLKDEQVNHLANEVKSIRIENRAIKDEYNAVQDENKSMKEQIEAIGREKEVLSERVGRLSDKLEREIDGGCQGDEGAGVSTSATAGATGPSRHAPGAAMEPARGDIDSLRGQAPSARVSGGPGQVDASCDWLIDSDVGTANWGKFYGVLKAADGIKTSDKFAGAARPYIYQLLSRNRVARGEFYIRLRIWAGPGDAALRWPFRGAVAVTVASRDRREAGSTQTLQCRVERPPQNGFSRSDCTFAFPHAVLRGARIDLERGVRVSCQIVPDDVIESSLAAVGAAGAGTE